MQKQEPRAAPKKRHTTRTTTKQQSASTNPPRAKRQRAGTVANTRHESNSEDASEEVDDTPLTRADIPKIVDAVLSNFSMEGTSPKDDSQADGLHLGEY